MDEMESEATDSGSFGPGAFPVLVRRLVHRLATGRLDVVAGGERRQLWIESGAVRAVVSEAEFEKLGAWLVAEKLLDPAPMALALLRQPDGVRFGAFLVGQGLLGEEVLQRALETQAVAITARLLVQPGAQRFTEGETLPSDAATIEMTTASLLVAAVRRVENAGELEIFAPADSYPRGSEDALFQYQRVQLSPEEAFLFSRIDGSMTIGQLRRVVPLGREAITRGLAALAVSGLVELRETPNGPATAARPETSPVPASEPATAEAMQFTAEQQREHQEVVRLAAECRARDFFRRLGLTHGASISQVHERYRQLIRIYHPDRTREPHLHPLRRDLAEISSAIQEAYDTLIDPEKRARYLDGLKSTGVPAPEEQAQDERRQRARRELARANVQRAQALVRAGDFGAAAQLLDEAVRAEPSSENLLLLARLELRNPMWSNRVLDHLRLAVTLDPKYTDAWLELATFWGRKGQKERQRECLKKIMAYDPANREATKLLSSIKGKT